MSFLEIRDLSYIYPNSGVRAVDGLSMEADRGEMIAVIGPNAAGKSTFGLLLKGLLKPESGQIRIKGKVRTVPGPDPAIGILFSNPENQLVTSVVEEDVAFGLEVLGQKPQVIEGKVQEILRQLGIEHLGKRMPHLLSGGEQQMAALAGVLVLDPDILVLDEPTTYLDPDARSSVLTAMRNLADQGKIIILITHNMGEAAHADRVLLFDNGHVAMAGVPGELFSQPDLAPRYGISPPFLMDLVLTMRSGGMDVRWPIDPRSLAGMIRRDLADAGLNRTGKDRTGHSETEILGFEAIRFHYGPEAGRRGPVLGGVDFSVGTGSIAMVCGANGSGKSTLLQMSNGLIKPDEGKVLLKGKPLGEWRRTPGGVPAKVALLFQNPERQIFSASVYDDIAFGPRNLGLGDGKINERVLKAAGWAGLEESILERSVFALSGGQMRRVAVAGVLAMEAEVLVLDEPTDGLDPAGAKEFFSSARRYCDETGTSIFMATHAVPEQIGCVDHFGHLAEGLIQSAGPPSVVLAQPDRTLPDRFLPDHLMLSEELFRMGVRRRSEMLYPARVRSEFLSLVGMSG